MGPVTPSEQLSFQVIPKVSPFKEDRRDQRNKQTHKSTHTHTHLHWGPATRQNESRPNLKTQRPCNGLPGWPDGLRNVAPSTAHPIPFP